MGHGNKRTAMAKMGEPRNVHFWRRTPPGQQTISGKTAIGEQNGVDERAGCDRYVFRRGGYQPPRGTPRGRAQRERERQERDDPPGVPGGIPARADSTHYKPGPKPNPKARQAWAPRACPHRAQPVTAISIRDAVGGAQSPRTEGFCRLCGTQLRPTHTNANRSAPTICTWLNPRLPLRVSVWTPASHGCAGHPPSRTVPRPPKRDHPHCS